MSSTLPCEPAARADIVEAAKIPDLPAAVLGVDTHRDSHTAAVVTSAGALLGRREFSTTAAGCRELLAWARTLGHIRRAAWSAPGPMAHRCRAFCRPSRSRYLRSINRQASPPQPRQDRRGRR
jgi:hypothetical protein